MAKKIHICHITNEHPRYDTRIFLKMCKSAVTAGYEVTLLCADDLPEEVVDDVHIKPVARKPKKRFERATKTANALYKAALRESADLYQLHDPELIRICSKLKKAGKKVIFDSHEDFPAQIMDKRWIPKLFRPFVAKSYAFYEKRVIKKLDFIIAVTEPTTARFLTYGTPAKTIHNYPLLSEFPKTNSPNNSTSSKNQTLCFTGGISMTRGMKQMFKLTEEVDINLQLAGRVFTKEEKLFEDLLKTHPKVLFAGPYSREEMVAIYNNAFIALLLFLPIKNHITTLPNKLFEYMAGGLPIVASDIDYWKPIFQKYNCGIQVNPFDDAGVKNAVLYLIQHPEEASAMGERGRTAVQQEYNWESESKLLFSIYEDLLEPNKDIQ
jgi:glycosyltransferase involved in cell wall biosynthesis